MERGLVTTIIPVFNRAGLLAEAVASVLAQTYRPIEVLIVDDASTDDTPAAADALAREHPEIRVLHQSANGGPARAREAGRLAARGEFIQHLDSDDVLLPRKFALQIEGLNAHPECGASYGWTRLVHADGTAEPHPYKRSGEKIEFMFPAMLQSRWWDTMTPLYRASLLDAAGPWSDLSREEDWEYDARIAAQGVKLHYVAEWLCEHRELAEARLSSIATAASWRDRAKAHELILRHAQRADITAGVPEMQHFARELFLLARQTGAAGLTAESQRLFELAREASGEQRNDVKFRVYAAGARLLGWRLAGRLACMSDRLR